MADQMYKIDLDYLRSVVKCISDSAFRFFHVSVRSLAWVITQVLRRVLLWRPGESSTIHIAGLGAEWPSTSYGPETFEEHIRQYYDISKPGWVF